MSTDLEFEIHDSDSVTQPFYWKVRGSNDNPAKSETLHNKSDAMTAAQTLKSSTLDLRFETFRSNPGSYPWTWHVLAHNNRILVASTKIYANEAAAQAAAALVKWNAGSAVIVDKTRGARSR